MQENKQTKRSTLVRLIAALVALIVIGGSLFAFLSPKGAENTGWLGVRSAYADGWKTLKKGSSGAEVRKAQQALKDLGYYTGRVDGNFSKAFEEAVFAFQKDFGLKETGALDEETYLFITEGIGDVPEEAAPPKAQDAGEKEAEEAKEAALEKEEEQAIASSPSE